MNKNDLDNLEKKIEKKVNKYEDTLLDSDAFFETGDYDISLNSTKDRMSKLPWIIAILLIVLISIITCSMFLNNNPQTIFTITTDKLFSNISKNIDDNAYDISKGNVKMDYVFRGNNDLFNELNRTNLDIKYVMDSSNDRSFYNFAVNYDGEKSLSFNMFNSKKNSFIYLNSIFDEYIKLDNIKSYTTIKNNDFKILLNGFNQAIDKVVTAEVVSGGKTDLDFEIKTLKVYQSKLVISKSNYRRVSQTFINSLKSNEEFVRSISKMFGISSSVTKNKLDDFEKKLNRFFRDAENVEIKMYIDRKKRDFVKCEILSKDGALSLFKIDNSYKLIINNFNNIVKLNSILTINSNKNKSKYDLTSDVIYTLNGENVSGKFNISCSNSKSSSFKNVNIKDYVLEKDLDDDEKMAIYSNIIEKKGIDSILQFLK